MTVQHQFRHQWTALQRPLRLRHKETGEYLHLSGVGLTKGTMYAWCGTLDQARRLKQGWGSDPWPFVAVRDKPDVGLVITRSRRQI